MRDTHWVSLHGDVQYITDGDRPPLTHLPTFVWSQLLSWVSSAPFASSLRVDFFLWDVGKYSGLPSNYMNTYFTKSQLLSGWPFFCPYSGFNYQFFLWLFNSNFKASTKFETLNQIKKFSLNFKILKLSPKMWFWRTKWKYFQKYPTFVLSCCWTQVRSHDDPKTPKKLIMFMMMMMLLLMVMMMMMTNKLLLVMMPCPDYTSSWTGAHLQALTYFLPFTSFWWWRRWWWNW